MNTKLTASGPKALPYAWEYSEITHGTIESAPIIAGDRLICMTSAALFALDIYSGQEVDVPDGFPHPLELSADPPPPLTHSRGMLYSMDGGYLVARQLSDGKEPMQRVDGKLEKRWKPIRLGSVTSVTAGDRVVIVCQVNPDLCVTGFDPVAGSLLWGPVSVSQMSPGPIGATRDAIVFVSNGQLFAVNIRSGDTRFNFVPAGDALSLTEAPQVGIVGDKAVVITAGTAVYGVDLQTGKQLWVRRAARPSGNTRWFTAAISEHYNRVVLANNDGELVVLELTTGALKWSERVPGLDQVSIVGDKVYAKSKEAGAKLSVYELGAGKLSYVINVDDPGRYGVVTGHGILFLPGETSIRALPFGDQNAALFNGVSSRITVAGKDEKQFEFRESDFTIETWICTTRGGEIVSGFPRSAGSEHHGFRINVNDQGRVRFSVTSRDAGNSFAASSALTNVADGSWHHVAVVRRGGGVEMYVDGISVEVFTANNGTRALDISGKTALTFGAFVPGQNPQAHFSGLLREMRIWDIALDSAKLQSRMQRALSGTEPQLLGYWPMDEADISTLKNHVPRHVYSAKTNDVRSFVAELALDTSVFPYLLDQANLQWPYTGHWSARGQTEITTAPVLDRSGVLAFGAGNMLYGVHASDGSRAWSKSTPARASAPVAAGGFFYSFTGIEGLITVDSSTGAIKRVDGFNGLLTARPAATAFIPAPAADGNYTAAASPEGNVWVVDNRNLNVAPGEHTWKWKAPAPLSDNLSLVDGLVYAITASTLHQLDPVKKKVNSLRVAGSHYVVSGDVIFCEQAAGTLVALSTADLNTKKATFALPSGTAISGMCASRDADLLLVATAGGDLFGLTFATLKTRWATRIPPGSAGANNALSVPVIDGRTVLCTSSSGTVAALDASTGEFRGLFLEPTRINGAPVLDAGTAYFGCADAPPDALLLDGALHSVVFGRTNVLRLGVDHTGARDMKPAYASITTGDILELMGVDQSCVEAWVNTKSGGEILSICASATSHYGLRLWLEQDGKIHFTSVDLPDHAGASWERISGAANSTGCDGRWHHIAVSRGGREELTIYLDGVALNTTTNFETASQPLLSDGLKVFIGADATTAAPANFFAGMIAEVRVWDTYLTATRVSARMHDKLVGNEPDLLAYWNFDTLSVHDGTRHGHEGKLETGGGSSGYWLADLNFTHPSYPYIETEGRLLQEGEEGVQGELANTIYQLTVVARRADGTPLANHDVRLWYVRHKGETGPNTIRASSPKANAQVKAVAPSHGDEESILGTTGNDGKVIFRLATSQRGHGPSLDVRPAFLPPNERYHVNVLIDSQKLEKPAPPRLEAQATLTQDYHWSTGDKKVDHTRDRSTWRAVISARGSDGKPRPGERFQLWAAEHVEVEVNGRAYPINPNNYQSFTANDNGELTVSLAASELRAPALSVWAGFMHRDERYTIPLDQEAHKKLSEIEGGDLSQPRMTNWKPDYDPAKDDKAVVKEGYKPHAGKVADAIQHVMSVTNEPAQGMRAGLRSKRAHLRADRRNFSDMRQVAATPSADSIRSLRTLKHIERQLPLEPESFKQSLSHKLGFENSIGFVFTRNDLELRPINTLAQVHSTFQIRPPLQAPKLLGNIFEDAWDAIEDAATAVWREAQKIAIFIADQVTLVIEYADRIVQKVVSSVKEAIEAVVHILKMIEAFIEEVIRFLMVLFDWSGILEAHKILKQIANSQMRTVRQITARGKDDFLKLLTSAFTKGSAPVNLLGHAVAATSGSSCRANDPHPEVQAQVNSVHGKYVNNKVEDGKDQTDFGVKPSIKQDEKPVDQETAALGIDVAESLSSALSDPLGVSFADLYESIKDLIAGDVEKVITRLIQSALVDFHLLGKALDCVDAALNAPIEIPFVSQLYKWITGEQLTLLDVTCLALAIPTHMGYAIYTLVTTGHAHRFADDAKGLSEFRLTAGQVFGEAPLLKSGLGEANVAHNRAMHWTYFVFYEFYTVGSGMVKAAQITQPQGGWKKADALWYVPGVVIDGLVSKTLLYTAGMKEEGWNDLDVAWNSSLYGALVGLDLFLALDAFVLGDSAPVTQFDKFKDWGKQKAKIGFSLLGAGLLGYRIYLWVSGESKQSALFQTRDVLNAVSLMFTFDDSARFVQAVGPENAELVVLAETLVKAVAGCMHIAAISAE